MKHYSPFVFVLFLLASCGISKNAEVTKPAKSEYIEFSLLNTSDQSIPLLIPSVMNPNLSPNSRSGLRLKVGQEVLFRNKGKRYVLLTVDNNIKNGDSIDAAELLPKRKAELGLK